MAEKTPVDVGGSGRKKPETVADLREAVDQKLDDLFGGLDGGEDDEPAITVLEKGAEISLPTPAPIFDADRGKPPAAAAPRKPTAKPPAESKTVERPVAPAPAPPKTADRQGSVARAAIQHKPGSARPPKLKKPLTAQARKAGKPRATPHLGRILLWGAVLGVVVCTAVYFKTYESKTPPASTAENGMFFYKVAPNTTPAPPAAAAPPSAAAMPASTDKKPAGTPPAALSAYAEQSYPYAVHMASYRDADLAKEKLEEYSRGVQAFLVYTDLGDKGIWYRLYFGHFPTATSAADAIQKYGLKDALVGHVRYACLTGSHASAEDAAAAARRLSAAGFLPYTVLMNGTYHVLVGAHPTAGGAETVRGELNNAGFAGKVIKR